jgi:hypothetical protein
MIPKKIRKKLLRNENKIILGLEINQKFPGNFNFIDFQVSK